MLRIWRKKAAWLIAIPAVLILALGMMLYNPMRTISSLRKLDEHFYVMTYYGGYGFLPQTEEAQKKAMELLGLKYPTGSEGCSLFTASDTRGNRIYGRNDDWYDSTVVLLYTDPPDGYASVSLGMAQYLGFDRNHDVLSLSLWRKLLLLAAPLVTADGMNEYGVTIAEASVPGGEGPHTPDKVTINGAMAQRLVLDHARSVDEAVHILEQYNISTPLGNGHFLIADSSGKSVVVELLDKKMYVFPNEQTWQAVTNFFVARGPGYYQLNDNVGLRRYIQMTKLLDKAQGVVSSEEAMSILETVSDQDTQWSAIYNMGTGDVTIAVFQRYDNLHRFHLQLR